MKQMENHKNLQLQLLLLNSDASAVGSIKGS